MTGRSGALTTGNTRAPGPADAAGAAIAASTEALRARAETWKIARLLRVDDPGTLAFLHPLPAAELVRLREQIVAALFDGAPEMLDRLAAATRLIPVSVAAVISQRVLGPRLAAAVAGRLDPGRAVAVIEKLPVAFTAAACTHLDPRRIPVIVQRLDEDLVVRIATRLADDGDFLTMGRFTGHVPDGALRRITGLISDEAVLRTGFFIDQPERVAPLLVLLGDERLESVLRTAAEKGLWPEALTVLGMAGPEPRAAVLALPPLRESVLVRKAVEAVADSKLWGAFLPLVGELPEESRTAVADAVGQLPYEALTLMTAVAGERDLWKEVIPLVERMNPTATERVLALPAFRR